MFASQNLRTSATLSNWKSLLEQRKSLHGGFGSDTLRRDMAEDLQLRPVRSEVLTDSKNNKHVGLHA